MTQMKSVRVFPGIGEAIHIYSREQWRLLLKKYMISSFIKAKPSFSIVRLQGMKRQLITSGAHLKKNRPIFIFYVYQKPEIAWKFTQAREKTEGRNIPKSAFIDEFFGAKDVVDRILKEYDKKVVVFLVKKDFEKNSVENIVQIARDGMSIDDYLQDSYTAYSKESLEKLL